jgi:hypothetical protein
MRMKMQESEFLSKHADFVEWGNYSLSFQSPFISFCNIILFLKMNNLLFNICKFVIVV